MLGLVDEVVPLSLGQANNHTRFGTFSARAGKNCGLNGTPPPPLFLRCVFAGSKIAGHKCGFKFPFLRYPKQSSVRCFFLAWYLVQRAAGPSFSAPKFASRCKELQTHRQHSATQTTHIALVLHKLI